jgi:hypothetical protein
MVALEIFIGKRGQVFNTFVIGFAGGRAIRQAAQRVYN